MENPFNPEEKTNKRSTLLTVLAVLTFIGSGLNFIGNVWISLNFEFVLEQIHDLSYEDGMESLGAMFEQSIGIMENAGTSYYGIAALLAGLSVVGAALMLRMNKLGFHLYAAAQIVWLIMPTLFGVEKFPGILGILLTGIFIWLYARELKVFEKQDTSHNPE